MERSTVHLYALCWNEERMLPYFFRHYDPIVSQYFIFDHDSTDRSRELLEAQAKVSLRHFQASQDSFVLSAQSFYNNAWKESRGQADWVIVCNVDEHFCHPDPLLCLEQLTRGGVTLASSTGFEMFSDSFPATAGRLADIIQTGMRREILDKTLIFNPTAIDEIGYEAGRHNCDPSGDLQWWTGGWLLHYKFLGLDYLMERSLALGGQLKRRDIAEGLGDHYRISEAEIRALFEGVRAAAHHLPFGETK
jgi:hypothetical protein